MSDSIYDIVERGGLAQVNDISLQALFRRKLGELPADSPATAVREIALRYAVHAVLGRELRHVVLTWNRGHVPRSWDIEVDAGYDGVHNLHVNMDWIR